MNHTAKKTLVFLSSLSLLLFFSSCTVDIGIKADANGSAEISYNSQMGQAFNSLLRSILKLSETPDPDTAAQIFNAADIKAWLAMQELKNAACTTDKNASLSINGVYDMSKAFLAAPDLFRLNKAGSKTEITITLSPEVLAALVESMSEDLKNYSDLLMAPVFTGEQMTVAEYKDLIASVYGSGVANELSGSSFRLTLVSPAGNSKSFSIPILELLTLTAERTCSISW